MLNLYQLFRPFLWVALAAFVLGFAAFLTLGGAAVARAAGFGETLAEPISTPQYYPGAGPVRIA